MESTRRSLSGHLPGAALLSPSSATSCADESPRVAESDLEALLSRESPKDHAAAAAAAAAWPHTRSGAERACSRILTMIALSAVTITISVVLWRSHGARSLAPPLALAPPMQAWVLGSNPERFASSSAAIQQAFPSLNLRVSPVPMVPLTDPRVEYERRADAWAKLRGPKARHPWEQPLHTLTMHNSTVKLRELSTWLGWMDMWTRAGADPTLDDDDWILMFEDDVAVVPQPPEAGPLPFDYTHALRELFAQPAVRSEGIVYLGACIPRWAPLTPPLHERNQFNSTSAPRWLSSRRASALCSHAIAFTKRRARTLSSDLAAFLHKSLTFQVDVNLRLLYWATQRLPFVFGAQRRSPLSREHFGLFYQDRKHHKSIINALTAQPSTAVRDNRAVAPILWRQSEMQAWILTSKPERYQSSAAAIERAFPQLLNIKAIAPVPLSDPRIEFRRRCDAWAALSTVERESFDNVMWRFHPPPLSNVTITKRVYGLSAYFGWIDMWSRAANDPALGENDWVMMFEDDVALVWTARRSGQALNYTSAFLELLSHPAVLDDGIVSLGLCSPKWASQRIPEPRIISPSSGPEWLSSRRAVGMCMHAMAFTKRRARSLHSDLSAWLQGDAEFIMDVDLRRFGRATNRWPFLFGDQRRSPQIPNHRGIFYQDRQKHRSIIDGAQAGGMDNDGTNLHERDEASTGGARHSTHPPAPSTAADLGESAPLIFPPSAPPTVQLLRDPAELPRPSLPAAFAPPPFPAGTAYRAPTPLSVGRKTSVQP